MVHGPRSLDNQGKDGRQLLGGTIRGYRCIEKRRFLFWGTAKEACLTDREGELSIVLRFKGWAPLSWGVGHERFDAADALKTPGVCQREPGDGKQSAVIAPGRIAGHCPRCSIDRVGGDGLCGFQAQPVRLGFHDRMDTERVCFSLS